MDKFTLLNTKNGILIGIFVSEDDTDIKIKYPYQITTIEGSLVLSSALLLSSNSIIEIKKDMLLYSPTVPEDSLVMFYNATREYDLISLKNNIDEVLHEKSNILFKYTHEAVIDSLIKILPDGISKESLEQRKLLLYTESPSIMYH